LHTPYAVIVITVPRALRHSRFISESLSERSWREFPKRGEARKSRTFVHERRGERGNAALTEIFGATIGNEINARETREREREREREIQGAFQFLSLMKDAKLICVVIKNLPRPDVPGDGKSDEAVAAPLSRRASSAAIHPSVSTSWNSAVGSVSAFRLAPSVRFTSHSNV
jgi:hypothetical protein